MSQTTIFFLTIKNGIYIRVILLLVKFLTLFDISFDSGGLSEAFHTINITWYEHL